MRGGWRWPVWILLTVAGLSVAGCLADGPMLDADPTPSPTSAVATRVAATVAPKATPVPGPYFPFPQHTVYTQGAIRPDHLSQAELDQAVLDFYEAWKDVYLKDDCGPGRYYILKGTAGGDAAHAISVSEGQGYGMIIAALMAGADPDAQAVFDGLYGYFRDHPSANSGDLMAWSQVQGCQDLRPGGTASATDGDMDIAYGLLLADRQWGSGGEIDYHGQALRVMDAVLAHDVNHETWTMTLGDWVTPAGATHYYGARSSDFMPGHLRAYHKATGDDTWLSILNQGYTLIREIQARHSPETGLLPDFIQDIHTSPRPADPGFLESAYDGWYYYNACRAPLRFGAGYLTSGDPRDLAMLSRLNAWMRETTGGDPEEIHAGYALDGHTHDDSGYVALAFVAPLGVGAMVQAENQQWLNDLWDLTVRHPLEAESYYGNTLKMLAMIVMSGNWWAP